MRNNLIPTPVTDRNGKLTTVHKRAAGAPSAGLSRLAGIAPSVAPSVNASGSSTQPDKKIIKVTFTVKESAYKPPTNVLIVGRGSLIHELGLTDKATAGGKRTVSITRGEIFDFMKLGVTVSEAAFLHTKGNFEQWKQDPDFAAATPASLACIPRKDGFDISEIDRTVDALRDHGVSPQKAQKVISQGLCDKHLDGALDIDQLCALFDRFEYSHSSIRGKSTEYSDTMDGIIDGRIPFENFEAGYSRTLIKSALDLLYPDRQKYRNDKAITEAEREDLLKNPRKIYHALHIAELASGGSKSFPTAYRTVEMFGFEAAEKYGYDLLLTPRADGSVIGVEGAQQVLDVFAYLQSNIPDGYEPPRQEHDGRSTQIYLRKTNDYKNPLVLTAKGTIQMLDAGATPEVIASYASEGLNADQICAVLTKETNPSLVSGWL